MVETVHIGRKIARLRELKGMKQEFLAQQLGISQQSVSNIENSAKIENEILDKIAAALGVTTPAIQNFSEDAIINYFHDQSNFNYHCTFNPLEKVIELYERLIQTEREKVELLKNKHS